MNRRLGKFGESWAVGYLTRQGYQILHRNVRYRVGEIDIIARDGMETVFVEVKCRRTSAHGEPQEAVTQTRFERLSLAIATYLDSCESHPESYRVDVVALHVDGRGKVTHCEHLKGVEGPRR